MAREGHGRGGRRGHEPLCVVVLGREDARVRPFHPVKQHIVGRLRRVGAAEGVRESVIVGREAQFQPPIGDTVLRDGRLNRLPGEVFPLRGRERLEGPRPVRLPEAAFYLHTVARTGGRVEPNPQVERRARVCPAPHRKGVGGREGRAVVMPELTPVVPLRVGVERIAGAARASEVVGFVLLNADGIAEDRRGVGRPGRGRGVPASVLSAPRHPVVGRVAIEAAVGAALCRGVPVVGPKLIGAPVPVPHERDRVRRIERPVGRPLHLDWDLRSVLKEANGFRSNVRQRRPVRQCLRQRTRRYAVHPVGGHTELEMRRLGVVPAEIEVTPRLPQGTPRNEEHGPTDSRPVQ